MNSKEAELRWERSLGSLNDDVYFSVARNYLGTIPTPFHKPQLNRQMTTLFSNEAFVKRIMECITPWDAKLLTVAWLLKYPSQDELCALFTGEKDFLHVHHSVMNLEERLLLVPAVDSGLSRTSLMVNPLLLDRLLQQTISLNVIFPPVEPITQITPTTPVFLQGPDKRMVRALISLHAQGKIPPGDKGVRTLRNIAIQNIFCAWNEQSLQLLLPLLNRMLVRLLIIHETPRETILNNQRAQWLLSRNQQELFQLMLVEGCLEQQLLGNASQSREAIGNFFYLFNAIASDSRILNKWELNRLCFIAAAQSSLTIKRYNELVVFLEMMGLVSLPAGELAVRELQRSTQTQTTFGSPVTLDTDLTLSYTNEPMVVEGKDLLHLIALVRKVDVVCTYELSRDSFRHALDLGCTLHEIILYLQEATAHKNDDAIIRLLTHWDHEFHSIKIYDGITLCTNERISRLIEGIPALQPHRIATISEGMYLMSRKTETQWRAILSDSGAVLLPHSIGEEHFVQTDQNIIENYSIPRANESEFRHVVEKLRKTPALQEHSEPVFIEELRKRIKSLHASKNEEEDLLAKLSRKLILAPSQVVKAQGRSSIMTASGFDFQGKLNLIKAAVMSSNDILEIHTVDEEGSTKAFLIEANELIGSNRDFSLRATLLPEREEKVLSIDGIFFVKKLRRSLFFQTS